MFYLVPLPPVHFWISPDEGVALAVKTIVLSTSP